MSLKRFGVSLDEELLESLDAYVDDNGFANRSQAIRFLIEKNIAEKKWLCNHIVAGTVIVMYEQSRRDIATRIDDVERSFQDTVLTSARHYINERFTLHVATVMGEAHRLTEFADRMTTIKGIRHGKLVMSRAD